MRIVVILLLFVCELGWDALFWVWVGDIVIVVYDFWWLVGCYADFVWWFV